MTTKTTNPTYREFFDEMLKNMKITPTTFNHRALAIVSIAEGVNTYWNPFNWTLPNDQGFKDFNSTGVKEYPDFKTGAYWSAKEFLINPRWSNVVTQIATAKGRKPILQAFTDVYAEWGSHIDFLKFTVPQAIDRLNMVMQGN